MKKIILFLLGAFIAQNASAQIDFPQNEVKINIANTIAIASVELGYELFMDDNQSIDFGLLLNDRMNYHSEKGSRNFKTNSFKVGYNFYFGTENSGSGFFASPFAKLRTGKFTEVVSIEEEEVQRETDMSAFIIGIGGGYKWNFNDTFVIGPYANVGRNFSSEVKDRFSAIEFNTGLSVGYRF
ncbi:autotransporter outer membrane beta-barrel domain-containing protein [Autumnicola musiva]|uniref:Autotransporter outer membrane beta-barrel domain-containing protein n=1 Tax=Autumnicola musiva TaxID=3075589 RepID=A0ABU3D4U9_9FLAO|nr:autotransporter outer membrane beta-barrel domain-containing protein [Zunongwangia sp. F117]MDT0676414.1 autotransporter outer membrane beta-barrel domain-containing protein [Zunongwangia sp. F117]